LAKTVHLFDLSADGTSSSKRVLLRAGVHAEGYPDGSTVDAEGCLWVCFFGGWRAERYASGGQLLQTVRLPCANATTMAFGGSDLQTARKGLSAAKLAEQPLAGGLFSFRAEVPGLPQHRIAQGVPA